MPIRRFREKGDFVVTSAPTTITLLEFDGQSVRFLIESPGTVTPVQIPMARIPLKDLQRSKQVR